MAQIGNVPEIIKVKEHLDRMMKEGLVIEWELPYENLLTRLSAAIFFVIPADEHALSEIEKQLSSYDKFHWRENTEQKLSKMKYRVEFNDQETERRK